MPTILSHPAVPLAIGIGLGARAIPPRLLAAGVIASMLPDIDVAGLAFQVPYGSAYGHRGFTHSPFFAAGVALLGAVAGRTLQASARTAFWFLFIAMASHGMLDALTDGGSGIAFLWPWSNDRFFAPFQVIEVSPIGISRFLSDRGFTVLLSELRWVWLPCAVFATVIAFGRRRMANKDLSG